MADWKREAGEILDKRKNTTNNTSGATDGESRGSSWKQEAAEILDSRGYVAPERREYEIRLTNGKNLGKVSYGAYKAIRYDALDRYKPKNEVEKKVIGEYTAYAKKQEEKEKKKNKQSGNTEKVGFGKWLGLNAMAGLASFNKSITSTLDFIIPTDFLGRYDFVKNIANSYSDLDVFWSGKAQEASVSRGKGWKTAGDIVSGTVAALPDAILAFMSGGTSISASGSRALSSGTAAASSLGTAVKTMIKKPTYWTSVLRTLGSDYEDAKARGANEFVASTSAILTTALNAGIEVGSGYDELPKDLKGGGLSAVKKWVQSSVEEGNEEIVQGITTNAIAKLLYDKDAPLVSVTDDTAVINPQKSAKEFGMGAAVGAILGGGQIGAAQTIKTADVVKTGKFFNKPDIIQSVIDTGLESPKESNAYKLAVRANKKKGKLSNYEVGKLYYANVEQIQSENNIGAEENKATEGLANATDTASDTAKVKNADTSAGALAQAVAKIVPYRGNDTASPVTESTGVPNLAVDTSQSEPAVDTAVAQANVKANASGEFGEIMDSEPIATFTPETASSEIKRLENILIANGANDTSRKEIIDTAIEIEKTLDGSDKNIRSVFDDVSKITSSVIKDIQNQAGLSGAYWSLFGENLKSVSSGNTKENINLITQYTKAYTEALKNNNPEKYNSVLVSATGKDLSGELPKTILQNSIPDTVQNAGQYKLVAMQIKNIINAADVQLESERNKIYGANTATKAKSIVLTRMGDFYEAFGDEALELADKLNLTSTYKTINGVRTAMVGFPIHVLEDCKKALGDDYSFVFSDDSSSDLITSSVETARNSDVATTNEDGNIIRHTKEVDGLKLIDTEESTLDNGKTLLTGIYELNSDKDFNRKSYKKEKFDIFIAEAPYVKSVDGTTYGHYGIAGDKAKGYMVTYLPAGVGVAKADTQTTAKALLEALENDLPELPLTIKAYGDKYRCYGIDEAVKENVKNVIDSVTENTNEITLPLKNKKELISYLKNHKGEKIAVSINSGDEEIRTIINATDTAIVTEKADGQQSRLSAKANELSYTDDGFVYTGSNGVTVSYRFIDERTVESTAPVTNAAETPTKIPLKLTDKCELFATKHTATDEDIWVVALKDRLSPDGYKDLKGKVKAVGGYYSKFTKTLDGKAMPGFVFKSEPTSKELSVFNNFFNEANADNEAQAKSNEETHNNTETENDETSNAEHENKPDLEFGDIIEYDGKKWRLAQTGFTMVFDNIDKTDNRPTFSYTGGMESFKATHDYKLVREETNEKPDITFKNMLQENAGSDIMRDNEKESEAAANETVRRTDSSIRESSDELQGKEQAGEVQKRADRSNAGGRSVQRRGESGIESRTIKDVCEINEFEKIKHSVSTELTVQKANELHKKYIDDVRLSDDVNEYDVFDLATYDMLTDPDNELRSLFADNISEYFNTDADTATDITGAKVSGDVLTATKDSVVKNKNGQLIPVYHGTGADFDVFERSDIGIHFGSYPQAVQRVEDKGIQNPKYIKAYLNITKPVIIDEDFFGWNSYQVSQKLDKAGALSHTEAKNLFKHSKTDVKKANNELTQLLQKKGYDGIVYNNEIEAAAGKSYIVFGDEQVFRVDGVSEKSINIKGKETTENVHNGLLAGESENDSTVREPELVPKTEERQGVRTESGELGEDVTSENGTSVSTSETTTPSAGQHDGGNSDNRVRKSNDSNGNSGAGIDGDDNVNVKDTTAKTTDFSITKAVAEEIDKSSPNVADNIKAIETLHEIETSGKPATKAQQKILANKKLVDSYKAEIETLKKEIDAEFPKAKELADLQAKLNDIDTQLGINVSTVDMSDVIIDDSVTDDGEKYSLSDEERTVAENEIFSALPEETKLYEKQVDTWASGEMQQNELFRLGNTPLVLRELGAKELPVTMTQKVMNKITGGKHDISLAELKKLPNAIADPIMVFKSATVDNSFILLAEMLDKQGNDVVVAMHLNRDEGFNAVNRIPSVYGKENIGNFVDKQTQSGNLLYVDKNKSQKWLRSRGLQLPKLNTIIDSNNSILQREDIVNSYFEQNIKQSIESEDLSNEQTGNGVLSGNGGRATDESTRKQAGQVSIYKQKLVGKTKAERQSTAKEIVAKGYMEEVVSGNHKYTLIETGGYNDDMRSIVSEAKAYGKEVGFFIGNAVRKFDGQRNFKIDGIKLSDNKILIRYDGTYSPQALLMHELVHTEWDNPETQQAKDIILSDLSESDKKEILQNGRYKDYMELYNGDEDAVWEEFIADIFADMNKFSDSYIDTAVDYWYNDKVIDRYNPSEYIKSIDTGGNEAVLDNIGLGNEYSLSGNNFDIPYNEKRQLDDYVLRKNHSSNKLKKVDCKEIGNNFYVWENNSKTDYTVVNMIEIDGNEDLISILRKDAQNGSFRTRESIRKSVAQYNGRFGSSNRSGIDDTRRRKTSGNGSVVGKVRADNGRGNIVESGRNKQTKYALNSYDTDSESLTSERKKAIFEKWEKDHTGLEKPTKRQLWGERAEWVAHNATRVFPNIPERGEKGTFFAEFRKDMIQWKNLPTTASFMVQDKLNKMTDGLTPDEFKTFSELVYFLDLQEEAQIQKERGYVEILLPNEITPKEVDEIVKVLNDEATDKVKRALTKRQDIWDDLKTQYVDLNRYIGFDTDGRFKRKNYYHHQVIEYMNDDKGGTGSREIGVKAGRSWLKERQGSTKAINTDFLAVENKAMLQMQYDVYIAETLGKIKKQYDIKPQLEDEAFRNNKKALNDIIQKECTDEDGNVVLDNKGNPDSETYRKQKWYNARIMWGFDGLFDLAERGELSDYDGEYTNVVEAFKKHDLNADGLYKYVGILSNLELPDNATDGQEQAVQNARTVLKYTAQKKVWIKELLADDYQTWETLAKSMSDTHTIHQPRRGNYFYTKTILDEDAFNKAHDDMVLSLVSGEVDFGNVDVKKLFEQYSDTVRLTGAAYEQWVLPKEIVTTMDEIANPKQASEGAKAARSIVSAWKGWATSVNPLRTVKFGLRNLAGDLDAVIAGNPKVTLYSKQAVQEIYQAMKHKNYSDDFMEWVKRGGYTSMIFANEMDTEMQDKLFSHLKDKQGTSVFKLPVKAFEKYYDGVENVHNFREAILRYSEYLYFKEEINKNSGNVKDYVASNRYIVKGLNSVEDKAYQLSKDLLGAYDEVGKLGQTLRRYWIPFYSFTETNMKRYYRMFENIITSDDEIPKKAGKLLLKALMANMLMLITTAWNKLVMKEQDDKLPPSTRNVPHITLGQIGDNVYAFRQLGSFSELLEWVGLDDYKWTKEDLTAPVDKAWGMITPFVKMPVELVSGLNFYPSLTQPRAIRDKWQHFFNSLGVDDVYNEVTGKPTRGVGEILKGSVIYNYDYKESAYYEILDIKREWQGNDSGSIYKPTPKSNALYYMKTAIRYKDKKAALKYLDEYFENGGTGRGLRQSFASLNPMYGFTSEDTIAKGNEFISSLSDEDTEKLKIAQDFYENDLMLPSSVLSRISESYITDDEAKNLLRNYIDAMCK